LEIPENLYHRVGNISQEYLKAAKDFIQQNYYGKSTSLKIGDTFNHPIWDEGIINDLDNVKKVYYIKFSKLDAVRPIDFSFFAEAGKPEV
jgi:DNA helicase-2/ATP-dependent DNA helicase PcrA